MKQQTRQRVRETPAQRRQREREVEDAKNSAGVAGRQGRFQDAIAKPSETETQAEGVEKAKPTPTPEPPSTKPKEDSEEKPEATPTPTPEPSGEPSRSDFPEGIVGQAAYSRALRAYRKNK